MVDKVKPLKIENAALGGTENDPYPREMDPTEDYVAAKGVAYENLDTFRHEKTGGIIEDIHPDWSMKPTYLGNGDIDYVEFFETDTQTTANRRAKITLAYDGNYNPTSETFVFYSESDGTTVLKTYTSTYTWTGVDLTKSARVTT